MEKDNEDGLIKSPFAAKGFIEDWIQDAEREKRALPQVKATKEVDGLTINQVGRDYIVVVPLAEGKVLISFSEIIRSRQSFETLIHIRLIHAKQGALGDYEQRIDLNSASALSNLATQLNSAFGNKKEGYNWVLILNRAGIAIKKHIQQERKPIVFNEKDEYETSTYLVEHFLEPGSPTLIHGDGSTGKSYFCLYMACRAALGLDFFGKTTKPFKTLYVDHEATAAKLKNRLHRVANGLNVPFSSLITNIHWYKPEGSIASEQEIIARLVEDNEYGAIIIDAGASASGGSPIDEQAVLKLFTALDHIPCAKLIIHHEPKDAAANDDKAYYGTTFWRNAPRLAWRLKRETKEGNKSIIRAIHHKANDDGESPPFTYSMDFPAQNSPAVLFALEDEFEPTDDSKIIEFLLTGEADLKAILDATDLPRSSLQRKIGDLLTSGKLAQKRVGKRLVYFVPGQVGHISGHLGT